jgi:hypothetical protein
VKSAGEVPGSRNDREQAKPRAGQGLSWSAVTGTQPVRLTSKEQPAQQTRWIFESFHRKLDRGKRSSL